MPEKFKRYCKTLTLKDDPALIEAYEKAHAAGSVWPEIEKGMKEVGILDMEIYRAGNRLFMIMDTTIDFDHEEAMKALGGKPRQAEWEAYVSRYQEADENSPAGAKWQLMKRVYKLDQQAEYEAIEGQVEECPVQ